MMIKFQDSLLSPLWYGVGAMTRWMWAIPKTLYQGVSWFSSQQSHYPDTEEGRLVTAALEEPNSLLDKSAVYWAGLSFWTKLGVLAGLTLTGFLTAAPLLGGLCSLILGIGVHSALVSHHQKRVELVTHLVHETQVARNEIKVMMQDTQRQVLTTLQEHQKKVACHSGRLEEEARGLHEAHKTLVSHVDEVGTVNHELHQLKADLHDTVGELHKATHQFAVTSQTTYDSHHTLKDAVASFTETVDEVAQNTRLLNRVVTTLHEAIVEVGPHSPSPPITTTTPDPSVYHNKLLEEHRIHMQETSIVLAAFELRQQQRAEPAQLASTTTALTTTTPPTEPPTEPVVGAALSEELAHRHLIDTVTAQISESATRRAQIRAQIQAALGLFAVTPVQEPGHHPPSEHKP